MKHNYLFLFMALAAILVISTSCNNSSEAANPDADNQHATQNTHDDQSNADSQNNAASADETNSTESNKTASQNEPDQEKKKDTSAENTENKKQAYLKQLNKTEKEMEKQRNNLDNHSTYALKGVEGNRFDVWDDLLNDIYDTLEKQLSEQEMESLRQEQRKWISDRDDEAKQASLKYEGGTQEQLEYAAVKADITKERCYELIQDYMN